MFDDDERQVMDLLRRFKDVNTSLVIKNRRLVEELTELNILVVSLRVDNRLMERRLNDLRTLGPDISQEIDRLKRLADERLDRELEVDADGEDIPKDTTTIELASEDDEETDDAIEEEEEDNDLRAEFDRRLQLEINADDCEGGHDEDDEKQSDENSLSLFAVFNQLIQTDDNATPSIDLLSSPPPKLMRMDQVETVVGRRRRVVVVGGGKPPKPELMMSAKKKTTSESRQKLSIKDRPKKKAVTTLKLTCDIDGCKFNCEEARKLSIHKTCHHKDRLTSKIVIGYRSGAPVYGCDLTGCQFQTRFSSHINRHKVSHHSVELKINSPENQSTVASVWFPCQFGCGYKTLNKGHLNTHNRNFHR